MKRLYSLEYYKNLTYKPFQIFTVLYFIFIISFLFIGLVDLKIAEGFEVNLKEQGVYNFPEIWNFTTWFGGILKIFLGLIIVFSICQEFTNRMFKQNTIDGLSRREFVISKLLTIGTFTVISTIIVFIITLAIGYSYSETTEWAKVTAEMYFVFCYGLKLFTFFCFLMFLSIVLRKSIFVLLAFFIWYIFENIIGAFEKYFHFKGADATQAAKILESRFFIYDILPLNSMSELIPNPIMRLKAAKIFGVPYKYSFQMDSFIACLIWCGLFIFGSYYILKKRDW